MTKQERLADMLMYVQEKKHFHLIEIMEKYNISNRTAKRDVQALKRSGLKIQSVPGIQGGCTVIDGQSVYNMILTRDDLEILTYALNQLVDRRNKSENSKIEELLKKLSN